jgi:hypothetical protein
MMLLCVLPVREARTPEKHQEGKKRDAELTAARRFTICPTHDDNVYVWLLKKIKRKKKKEKEIRQLNKQKILMM